VANLLDRFNKTVVGADDKDADYQSKIVTSGDFKRITDIEVILSSWSNILITPKRTYQYDPEFGSDLYKLVFEPADEATEEQITQEVIETLRLYDPRAIIQDVTITFITSRKAFNVAIEVEYKGDQSQLDVIIDEDVYFKFLDVPEIPEIGELSI
jgi:phage baseplate assembly protein W